MIFDFILQNEKNIHLFKKPSNENEVIEDSGLFE